MVKVNMAEDCQFLKDLQDNSSNVNRGIYNQIISIRDLMLYSKGIKPHRNWKITQVKKYFGITGNKETMLAKLQLLKQTLDGGE